MRSPDGFIPKGETHLIEQAGRDCTAWTDDPGVLWWAKDRLPHEDQLGTAKGIAIGAAIIVPLWIALFWWLLS